MKFYKYRSIPLEEVELSIGDKAFDEYGNYIVIDAFNSPEIIKKSVLKDNELVNKYNNEKFLKAFWAMTKHNLEGNDIYDEID